jgi:hypothetical protein
MSITTEWNAAISYDEFLKSARENVELMKARFNDLTINEYEEELLSSIQNDINILVIGTDRCNDTAGNLPILGRMASMASKVHLRVLDSDKHAQFHQNYRVYGKRKTPVVLFLSPEFEELCRWVERPNAAYKIVNEKTAVLEERQKILKKIYSDPEVQRQSLTELLAMLLRADYLLGRT